MVRLHFLSCLVCKVTLHYYQSQFHRVLFIVTVSVLFIDDPSENYWYWMEMLATVTANWLKSQNGTLFSHVWRRGRLALDPLQNKSCSEFFSQADKNWHITWGNNLGPDWPPLARGSKFHTITHPPGRFLLSPR